MSKLKPAVKSTNPDLSFGTLLIPKPNLAIEANKSYVIVTFGVKNAFNTVKWTKKIAPFAKSGAPKYLVLIIIEFFRERLLCYDSDDRPKTYITTCGVPRGSVFSWDNNV